MNLHWAKVEKKPSKSDGLRKAEKTEWTKQRKWKMENGKKREKTTTAEHDEDIFSIIFHSLAFFACIISMEKCFYVITCIVFRFSIQCWRFARFCCFFLLIFSPQFFFLFNVSSVSWTMAMTSMTTNRMKKTTITTASELKRSEKNHEKVEKYCTKILKIVDCLIIFSFRAHSIARC